MHIPPFFMDGLCEDLGYQNTRDHPKGERHKHFVEQLWVRFSPLADPHFREDARNHFLQRFWEMYLAVTLQERGFMLHRHGNEGPEFYAAVGDRRIWFEAIAPGPGTGQDEVLEPVPGKARHVPTEQILLRFTNALDEKRKRYSAAMFKGIIRPGNAWVLAINSRGIPSAPYGGSLPYFVQSFLPFGPYAVSVDTKTFDIKDAFYQYQPHILKANGSPVSTRTFLDDPAQFCTAVLHSTVDCANHPDQLGDDFSILHNPRATCPLDLTIFDWCEQFTYRDNQLLRTGPNNHQGGEGLTKTPSPDGNSRNTVG